MAANLESRLKGWCRTEKEEEVLVLRRVGSGGGGGGRAEGCVTVPHSCPC